MEKMRSEQRSTKGVTDDFRRRKITFMEKADDLRSEFGCDIYVLGRRNGKLFNYISKESSRDGPSWLLSLTEVVQSYPRPERYTPASFSKRGTKSLLCEGRKGRDILPESFRWFVKNDHWVEVLGVLVLLHHGKDDVIVKREMAEIRKSVEFDKENADVSIKELFHPKMLNRLHIGVFTQIWSQLTGMNVMMYYITYVFAMAGLKGDNVLLSSSIQYVINVVMTIPALIWIDVWGRRPTLLVGSTLMMTWLFINAAVMASTGHAAPDGGLNGITAESWSVTGPASKVVIACSYLFVASFAPTWGPVSWVYPPELFPLRVRGKAVALATSANWAFNFALGYFVPPAFENIKWQVYILFGVFCFVMTIHVFFMFPETAGKSLEEVETMFLDPKGIKWIGTPAWRTHVVKNALGDEPRMEKNIMGEHREGLQEERSSGSDAHAQDEEGSLSPVR